MSMNPLESEEQLTRALQGWVVDTPLPPRFQERVWRGISQAEAKPALPWVGRVLNPSHVIQFLTETLVRPRVAYTYVAVLAAFGIAGGVWTAQLERNRLETALGERYVQSLDPYQFAVVPSR